MLQAQLVQQVEDYRLPGKMLNKDMLMQRQNGVKHQQRQVLLPR
jgi:hypothetical protein